VKISTNLHLGGNDQLQRYRVGQSSQVALGAEGCDGLTAWLWREEELGCADRDAVRVNPFSCITGTHFWHYTWGNRRRQSLGEHTAERMSAEQCLWGRRERVCF